jgi:hypothetical protein
LKSPRVARIAARDDDLHFPPPPGLVRAPVAVNALELN